MDGLTSARSFAEGGSSAESGLSGSSKVDGPVDAGCSSGLGRSDIMDDANASSGKTELLYGKIPVDLNPEVIFRGVTADKKASFISPGI